MFKQSFDVLRGLKKKNDVEYKKLIFGEHQPPYVCEHDIIEDLLKNKCITETEYKSKNDSFWKYKITHKGLCQLCLFENGLLKPTK
jgi:predicted transcriptional regulator